MHYKKSLILIPLCLTVGFLSCSKEEKKMEAPKQEQIEKNLVPSKAEVKGQAFVAELSDLKVVMTVDTTSKEISATPYIGYSRGHFRVLG